MIPEKPLTPGSRLNNVAAFYERRTPVNLRRSQTAATEQALFLERSCLRWRAQWIQPRAATEGIMEGLAEMAQAGIAHFQRGFGDVELA